MIKLDLTLLAELCTIPGAPGYESRIRKKILELTAPFAHKQYIDNMGNLIVVKKGSSDAKKIMLAAHMDEISFIVTHIDEQGFLKFHPLGGFDPKTLTSMRVLVHGTEDLMGVMGAKPIHIMSAEERNKAPQLHDFYIDLGLPKEKVQEMVSVGNPVTRYQQFVTFGDMVNTKSLDNRVAVYIQIEALKSLKNPPYDVYAVFTVQEEVGLRGALVAAHHINPDFGIAIDVTVANDTPGSQPHEKITQLGKGTAIKIMDSGTICDPRMVSFLQLVANGAKIPWQPEILTAGGTDTAGIQRMSTFGAIAGAISIPLRYVHQVTEMAHQQDIAASIDLLTKACEQLDHYTWDPL